MRAAPGFQRDGNLFELDLVASWDIDLFGGLRRQHEASLADYQAARADAVAARLAIAAQTADTYVMIWRAAGPNRRGEARGRHPASPARDREASIRQGRRRRASAGQAEGALSQVEGTLPVLEDGLESSMNAPSAIPTAPEIASAGSPTDLLRRRPDIIVAQRRFAVANARIGETLSEYYPKISLSGLIGTATKRGSNFLQRRRQPAPGRGRSSLAAL